MAKKDLQQLQTIKERMIAAGIPEDEVNALVDPLKNELQRRVCGLVWEHTTTSIPDMEEKIPALTPVADKNIVNDINGDNHVLIEGENLLALMAMQYTHIDENGKGMIDVIYIDPPYNTGSVTFVYNDKFEKSEWLSMMDIRLKLARNLLKDEGVIFISIDDSYQAELKMLCDDIYGGINHIGTIIPGSTPKNNSKFISIQHEYVLVYAKKIEQVPSPWLVKKNNIDEYIKKAGQVYKKDITNDEKHKELLNLVKYPRFYDFDHYTYVDKHGVFQTVDMSSPQSGGPRYDVMHPVTKRPCTVPKNGWRYTLSSMEELLEKDAILFGENETIIPRKKSYISEYVLQTPRSVVYFDPQKSSKAIQKMGLSFDYVKPVDLIKWLISMYPNKDALILDFFAGSGTTGHAVLDLNKEDGGHRRFILCTNNEIQNSQVRKLLKTVSEIEENDLTTRKINLKLGLAEDATLNSTKKTIEDLGVCHAVTYPRMQNIFPDYPGNNLYYYRIDQNIAESAIDDVTIANMASRAVFYVAMKENVFNAKRHDAYYLLYNDKTDIAVVTDPDMDMFDVEDEIVPTAFSRQCRKVYCSVYEPCMRKDIEYIPYPKEVLDVLKAAKKYIRREVA